MIAPAKISSTEDGVRLHRWFARHYPALSAGEFYKLCRSGQIRINSKRCVGREILRTGDFVRVPPLAEKAKSKIQAIGGGTNSKSESGERFSMTDLEKLRKCIIHDDSDIVVFNKPSGLAVQGGTGIKMSLDKMAAALFPYDTILPVHRLDRETSGVIVLAKNQSAAQRLSGDFQSKTVSKEYLALLSGHVSPRAGVIDTFMVKGQILTSEEASAFMATTGSRPRRAITRYKVLNNLTGVLTWIQFWPSTGRTHQLRLHAAQYLNAPIVGDELYGIKHGTKGISSSLTAVLNSNHLFLFARRLSFKHPRTGRIMTIVADLPEFMKPVVKFLEFSL